MGSVEVVNADARSALPHVLSDIELGKTHDPSSMMQIVYRDVKYTVLVKEKKKGSTEKEILHGVTGRIEPARFTAVMGASGAGKTTLLNVLAGVASASGKTTGSISVNGQTVRAREMRKISAFVHQEDVIMDTFTVREALIFSAMLRLPSDVPRSEKEKRAVEVADLLNLGKSLNSVVGSATMKGISGGEKRRLSLGLELITNPAILYLDEPTSGLDTYNAYKVTSILHTLAHDQGRTIVCTIHQPSSDIFHMFDDLTVLADGSMLYQGQANKFVNYFANLGYDCPTYTNPADYLFMSILHEGRKADSSGNLKSLESLAHLDTAADNAPTKSSNDRQIQHLLKEWSDSDMNKAMLSSVNQGSGDELINEGISSDAMHRQASLWTQWGALSKRAANNTWRNKLLLKGKLAQTIFLSLVVGLIYLNIGNDFASVQDRLGSLFFLVVQGFFGALMGVLTVFGTEVPVFQREYTSNMYSLPAYFFSRWFVDLPSHVLMPMLFSAICYFMIGYQETVDKFFWFSLIMVLMDNCGASIGMFVSCLFSDIATALAVMPMILMPLMVFSGFFVNSSTIPPYFIWISYISPMRYGFIALAINEFTGLTIDCEPGQCAPGYDGETVLNNLGFSDDGTVGQNAAVLFGLMCFFLICAYAALWVGVRRLRK